MTTIRSLLATCLVGLALMACSGSQGLIDSRTSSPPPTASPSTSPRPTVTPTPSPSPEPLPITQTSLTQSVDAGDTAKVAIETSPKVSCSIEVTYDSGPSQASGLKTKTSDSAGKVIWSWIVGRNTAKGTYPIHISCTKGNSAGTLDLEFTVK